MRQDEIQELFTYHPPSSEAQIDTYEKLRNAVRSLAYLVHELTPGCPEQTIAIRKLHEASMAANSAVALHPDFYT